MKVTTAYPVIINKVRKSYPDYYLNINGSDKNQVLAFQKYANSKGARLVEDGLYYRKDGAKSKTAIAYDVYGAEWEKSLVGGTGLNLNTTSGGGSKNEPTLFEKEEKKKKGLFWDKAKNVWVKGKESGIIDQIGNMFGLNMGGQTGGEVVSDLPTEAPAEEKKMSTGVKIAIGVGIVVVLGTIIYFATRKKAEVVPAK